MQLQRLMTYRSCLLVQDYTLRQLFNVPMICPVNPCLQQVWQDEINSSYFDGFAWWMSILLLKNNKERKKSKAFICGRSTHWWLYPFIGSSFTFPPLSFTKSLCHRHSSLFSEIIFKIRHVLMSKTLINLLEILTWFHVYANIHE
jgi:hypothetical protein